MAADGKFISRYAKDNPTREDVSESSTSWFATRKRTDRQPANDVRITEATIPNRMNYFDKHLGWYRLIIDFLLYIELYLIQAFEDKLSYNIFFQSILLRWKNTRTNVHRPKPIL